jgi:hypothetical protein
VAHVHSTNAINAARAAVNAQGAEAKANELARAIEALAWALRDIEKKLAIG